MKKFSVFSLDKNIVGAAFIAALRKLDPRAQIRNPVMFMVYVGAIMTSIPAFWQGSAASLSFKIQLVSWLWLTILFANFAGALAEGQT
ncbi:MAG TPA: potassium-transporting ATPase subunit B, partial [Leptospiraceae bacterium]|nr:potassium-transporting ATPase subunit B [Leptospiraceae bacterium]